MWEKKKSLVKSNFCFSHIVFSPIGELSAIFNKFEICHLQLWEFGSLKFVVWERVKSIIQQLMRGHVVFANHYWFHSKFNAINVEKKQNFWLATPFGLTNQKLCYFQIWKKKKCLTHYHTILHFDALKIYSCRKHCEKKRNCLLPAFSLFLKKFSNPIWYLFSVSNAFQNLVCNLFHRVRLLWRVFVEYYYTAKKFLVIWLVNLPGTYISKNPGKNHVKQVSLLNAP